jgi:hypothetical protein
MAACAPNAAAMIAALPALVVMIPSSPERRVFATSTALKTQHGRETLRRERKDRALVAPGEHAMKRTLRYPSHGGGFSRGR